MTELLVLISNMFTMLYDFHKIKTQISPGIPDWGQDLQSTARNQVKLGCDLIEIGV